MRPVTPIYQINFTKCEIFFIRSETLRIFFVDLFEDLCGNIGMYPTALPLVNNYKNKNYRIYTFKLESLSFF